MSVTLWRRLIGSAVLLLAALVFIPLLLTGEGYQERQLTSQIPPPPPAIQPQEMTPQRPVLADTARYPAVQQTDSTPVTASIQPAPAASPSQPPAEPIEPQPVRPQLDSDNVPAGWALQLASFKDQSNANALKKQLRDRLNAAGFKVYSRTTGDLHKVFIGPDLQRERLEQLKETLKSDFGLEGIIIRFTVQ